MARERKSLIEPGSLLPNADTLFERILERDRLASGRAPAETTQSDAPPSASRPTVFSETNFSSSSQMDYPDINITDNITSNEVSNEVSNAEAQEEELVSDRADLRAYAQGLAATAPIPITLRLPEGLNDWLDDYAHAHRKRGVKKQDLVARAVELLVLALSASRQDTETTG